MIQTPHCVGRYRPETDDERWSCFTVCRFSGYSPRHDRWTRIRRSKVHGRHDAKGIDWNQPIKNTPLCMINRFAIWDRDTPSLILRWTVGLVQAPSKRVQRWVKVFWEYLFNFWTQAGANMIVSGSAIMKSDAPREVINVLRGAVEEAIQKSQLERWSPITTSLRYHFAFIMKKYFWHSQCLVYFNSEVFRLSFI